MNALLARAAALGDARARRIADVIAELARDDLPPDVAVERTEDGIVLSGRGLIAREARDPRVAGLVPLAKGMIA